MARKLRIQYEGAIYHVMNRGDRREDIFHDDQDRQLFLKTLGEACEKTADRKGSVLHFVYSLTEIELPSYRRAWPVSFASNTRGLFTTS